MSNPVTNPGQNPKHSEKAYCEMRNKPTEASVRYAISIFSAVFFLGWLVLHLIQHLR
ncbi:MAG: hypothetical protein KatS3mg069_2501 [Meiothermus sp.]|jgi:hypothetical protein|nr:MAG: hypothetical protein KatS3mg069_2501 [Meiothermus sp.]